MPEQVAKALVLLERALALDPLMLAHAFAAMAIIASSASGLREENRAASMRRSRRHHAWPGRRARSHFRWIPVGMDETTMLPAFTAFDAALALSPHQPRSYFRQRHLGWTGAERAIA